jgi:hypothetical protein
MVEVDLHRGSDPVNCLVGLPNVHAPGNRKSNKIEAEFGLLLARDKLEPGVNSICQRDGVRVRGDQFVPANRLTVLIAIQDAAIGRD